MLTSLSASDWLALALHFMSLSLLAIGGAITTAPDMHRYLVSEQAWLSDGQFVSSIALAQAAPGPNVLFIALLGWNVGYNSGGWPAALLGVLVAPAATLAPSCTLTYAAARWGHNNCERMAVRAFKQGMAPVVIALLMATGSVLSTAHANSAKDWPLWLLTAFSALLVWRTRLHMLWLLATGALLGGLGWV